MRNRGVSTGLVAVCAAVLMLASCTTAAFSYRIEYVDSKGLNVDLEQKTIHRNYMRWIRNLDKEIALTYYK